VALGLFGSRWRREVWAAAYPAIEAFGEAAEHGCQQLAPGSCCAVDAKPRHARVHQRPACSGIAAIEKRRRRPTV